MSARAALGTLVAMMIAASSVLGCGHDPPPAVAAPIPDVHPPEATDDACPLAWSAPATEEMDRASLAGRTVDKVCVLVPEKSIEETALRVVTQRVAEPFSAEHASADLRTLLALGSVEDVEIAAIPGKNGRTVTMLYLLTVRPLVAGVTFAGATALNQTELAKAFPLHEGQRFNRSKLREATGALEEEYSDRGYTKVHTTFSIEPVDALHVRLRIDVQEGPLVHVAAITFPGAAKIPTTDLLAAISTQTGAPMQAALIERDALVLNALYYDRGMADARVTAKQTESADQVDVAFEIKEGIVYRIGNIHVDVEALGTEKELLALLLTKPGAIFSRATVTKDVETLRERGRVRSLDIDVEPEVQLDPKHATMDLTLRAAKR